MGTTGQTDAHWHVERFLQTHSGARRIIAGQIQEANRLKHSERAGATIEVEARLCHAKGGEFDARVDEPTFHRICAMLQRSDRMDATSAGWCKVIDVFYKNSEGEMERGRSSVDSESMQFHTANVMKHRIQKIACRVHGTTSEHAAISVCTSREITVDSNNSELFVEPKFVRYKLARSYRCISGGCTWRYDIAQVWTATRVADASQKSKNSKPCSYEVEVELEQWGDSVECEYVADSLILKIVQLYLGCDREIANVQLGAPAHI